MSEQPSMPDRTSAHDRSPLCTGGLFVYRQVLSPILHTTQRTLTGSTGACRFQPTCSEYAATAVQLYGARRGGWLALLRFLRCHPFSRGGFDPVPGFYNPAPACDEIHADRNYTPTLLPAETASHLP